MRTLLEPSKQSLNGNSSRSKVGVFALPAGWSGCAFWRMRKPLEKLMELGTEVNTTIAANSNKTFSMSDVISTLSTTSIAHLQAPGCSDAVTLMKLYHAEGKKIVVDYDDYSFDLDPGNPRYAELGTKECEVLDDKGNVKFRWRDGENGFDLKANVSRYDGFVRCVELADMVTTTTDYIADKFRPLNKNVRILPNSIDLGLWKPLRRPAKYADQVRIGWFGGDSHYVDLLVIKDAIPKILQKYPQARFVIQAPKHPEWVSVFKDIPQDRFEWYPWVDLRYYTLFLASRHIDIGLCPLADNTFNKCKSSIKWMEFAAFRTPSICQNIPPYSKTIDNGSDGLLADTEQEWVDHISMLIEDRDTRNIMGSSAYDSVARDHELSKNCRLWERAYKDLAGV